MSWVEWFYDHLLFMPFDWREFLVEIAGACYCVLEGFIRVSLELIKLILFVFITYAWNAMVHAWHEITVWH